MSLLFFIYFLVYVCGTFDLYRDLLTTILSPSLLFFSHKLFHPPSVALFPYPESHGEKGASEHDEHVHGDVDKSDIVVNCAQVVPRLGLGHEVRETEQEVGQDEHCYLIERLNVICGVICKRSVPLQVN